MSKKDYIIIPGNGEEILNIKKVDYLDVFFKCILYFSCITSIGAIVFGGLYFENNCEQRLQDYLISLGVMVPIFFSFTYLLWKRGDEFFNMIMTLGGIPAIVVVNCIFAYLISEIDINGRTCSDHLYYYSIAYTSYIHCLTTIPFVFTYVVLIGSMGYDIFFKK